MPSLTCVALACDSALRGHLELLSLVQEYLLPLEVLGPTCALRVGSRRLLQLWVDAARRTDIPIADYTAPALHEAIDRFGAAFLDRAIAVITLDSPLWTTVVHGVVRVDARRVLELLHARMPHVSAPMAMCLAADAANVSLLQWLQARDFGRPTNAIMDVMLAAASGSLAAVERAVVSEARGVVESSRETVAGVVLDTAARVGHFHIVQWLYEHGLVKNEWRTVTAVCIALSHNHVEIAEYLASQSNGVRVQDVAHVIGTYVRRLFDRGDVAKLQWLHDRRLLAHFVERKHVELAKTNGHVAVLDFLETQLPEVYREAVTPFSSDNAQGGSIEMAQWALARGRLELSLGCIFVAARRGHSEFVRWYMAATQGKHLTNAKQTNNPVPAAAQHGSLECVKLLVENGWGRITPEAIVTAAAAGHGHVVEWLLDHCEELPLAGMAATQAAAAGHLELVTWLQAKFDLDLVGAIVPATRMGQAAVVEFLLQHTTPSTTLLDGALHEAVGHGHLRLVRLLPWSSNCEPVSMARLARIQGHDHVANWIRTYRIKNIEVR